VILGIDAGSLALAGAKTTIYTFVSVNDGLEKREA
jgi:allophanate hydrolase subunit 1